MIHQLDPKKVKKTDQFKEELESLLPKGDYTLKVNVCTRGSWRVGYSYSGNYKVTISYRKAGSSHNLHGSISTYSEYNTKKVVKWFNKKIKPRLELNVLNDLVWLYYRKSGLIPKHIAKSHTVWLKKNNLSWRDSKSDCEKVLQRVRRYVNQYGICSKCGIGHGWQETVLGITCNKCGLTIEY